MNREIFFRGRSFSDGGWVFGDLEYERNKGLLGKVRIHTYKEDGSYDRQYLVESDTVGQFTGMTDKNGVNIFEGDIVECVSWNEYFTNPDTGEVMQPFRRKMFVDYRKGGFKMVEPMPEPMKDNEWDIICNGDIVIIGNIYDNQELLSTK